MTTAEFVETVRQAVDELPAQITDHLQNVVIDVEKEPSVEFLRQSGFSDEEIEDGDSLYGIFMPMETLVSEDMLDHPARIIIFQKPLEESFPDKRQLKVEIRKTVVHEIAHHFGWTDRDLEKFDNTYDPFSRER